VTLPRRPGDELMDRHDVAPMQLGRSLRDLAAVNRWLGGRRTAVALVLDLAQRVPVRPVTVLDVGTGGADIPTALVGAGRRASIALRITASDVHPITARFAQVAVAGEPAIVVVTADALGLPFGDGSFDLATSFTTLHHFGVRAAARVLREMDRVARYGVIVTDLSRSRPALLGARALAATAWRRHPVTKHDGPVSVRAAFTPGEMTELGRSVFGEGCRVRRHLLFRLSLVVDRTPPSSHDPEPGNR
jgi:SAM-dependent methyltransferase